MHKAPSVVPCPPLLFRDGGMRVGGGVGGRGALAQAQGLIQHFSMAVDDENHTATYSTNQMLSDVVAWVICNHPNCCIALE